MKNIYIIFLSIIIVLSLFIGYIGFEENSSNLSSANTTQEPVLYITCDNTTIIVPLKLKPVILYRWIHSVEGTPIIEVYNATPQGIVLVMVASQSFGAGHPYSAEELNGTYTVNESFMIYSASSPVGKILRIHGDQQYTGKLRIVLTGEQNREIICPSFVNSVLEIKP
jgi:hypothetical protein